mmetsp:Transcript_38255/g.77368  ORF Transcript_38255/g.77368 Transcript_38255/m.77368 type:complete len:144 (-) Transcript_38255:156-587(-)
MHNSEQEWKEVIRLLTISIACLIVTLVCGALLAWSLFLSWGGITHVEYAILCSDANQHTLFHLLNHDEDPADQQTEETSAVAARKREQRLLVLRAVRSVRGQHGWRNMRDMLGVDEEGGWLAWFVSRRETRGQAVAETARKGA